MTTTIACHVAVHSVQGTLLQSPTVQMSGALYGLLVSLGGKVIAIERARSAPPVDSLDVMVLDNFVLCNASIR